MYLCSQRRSKKTIFPHALCTHSPERPTQLSKYIRCIAVCTHACVYTLLIVHKKSRMCVRVCVHKPTADTRVAVDNEIADSPSFHTNVSVSLTKQRNSRRSKRAKKQRQRQQQQQQRQRRRRQRQRQRQQQQTLPELRTT